MAICSAIIQAFMVANAANAIRSNFSFPMSPRNKMLNARRTIWLRAAASMTAAPQCHAGMQAILITARLDASSTSNAKLKRSKIFMAICTAGCRTSTEAIVALEPAILAMCSTCSKSHQRAWTHMAKRARTTMTAAAQWDAGAQPARERAQWLLTAMALAAVTWSAT